MAYDEGLAERIREQLADLPTIEEKRMFGGLVFMVRGHMCCGIVGSELMVRVGPDQYAQALCLPHARKMDFTGRPMKGFLYVGERGIESDQSLKSWIGLALSFVNSLPDK